MSKRLPTLYIPHGGGPCFFMEPQAGLPRDLWDGMASYLRGIGAGVGTPPESVLVISAHWEMAHPTVGTNPRPPLLFDYYGFPEHTYRLTYPAPGSPRLAKEVRSLLAAAGIESGEDPVRGLDHGVFVPFKLIYPNADVPMVQLSLQQSLDAATHFRIGRALAPLREQGVLIVGSGMSYHNMRHFRTPHAIDASARFDAWLGEAVEAEPAARDRSLEAWSHAPSARESHPREEHLLPLMVAAGAAGDDRGRRVFRDEVMGAAVSAFTFGAHHAMG